MGILDRLKGLPGDVFHAVESPIGLAVDLATAPWNDNEEYNGFWNTLVSRSSTRFGDLFQPALDVTPTPVLHALNTAYNEGFSQPVSAALTAGSLASSSTYRNQTGKTEGGALFDPSTWSDAYHIAEHRSPGQSLVLAVTTKDILDKPEVDHVESNTAYKVSTGLLDAAARIYLDPVIVAGKVAKVQKVEALATPIKTQDDVNRYIAGSKFSKLNNWIEGKSANEVRQTLFREHPEGGAIAHALTSANGPEERALTMRAMLGDTGALSTLGEKQAALAGQIGRLKGEAEELQKNQIPLNSTDFWGLAHDSANSEARVTALNAEVDQLYPQQERLQRLYDPTSNEGLANTLTYEARVSHSPIARSTWYQASPYAAPVRLITGMLPHRIVDLNRPTSINQFQRMLDQTPMELADKDKLLSEYAGAVTTAQRDIVGQRIEAQAVRSVFDHAGISQADQEKILAHAASGRSRAKTVLGNAVYDGEDRARIQFVDEDGSTVINYPLLATQTKDYLHLSDIHEVNRLVRQHGSHIRTAAGLGVDLADEVLNAFYGVWKPAALLRPAWPMRVGIDEQLRVIAKNGALTQLRYLTNATTNFWHNRASQAAGLAIRLTSGEDVQSLERSLAEHKITPDEYLTEVRARHSRSDVPDEETLILQAEKDRNLTREEANDRLLQIGLGRVDDNLPLSEIDAEGARSWLQKTAASPRRQIGVGKVNVDNLEFEAAFGPDPTNPNIFAARRRNGQGPGLVSSNAAWDRLASVDASASRREVDRAAGQFTNKSLAGHEAGYASAWEHAVNVQLGMDPLARQLLEGKDFDSVVEWLDKTSAGRAHARKLPLRKGNPRKWVGLVQEQVDAYTMGRPEIQRAALDQQAKYASLLKVEPDVAKLPLVHGAAVAEATGASQLAQYWNKSIRFFYQQLGRKPTDALARSPFFAETYKRELHARAAIFKDSAEKSGYEITDADMARLERQAREGALHQTKMLLYDLAEQSNLAHLMRFVSPFYMAWQEAITRWAKLAYDDPSVIGKANAIWGAPERAGIVVDQDGNPVTDPYDFSRTHYLAIKLPKSMQKGPLGEFPRIRLGKNSFNLWLNLPGTGPPIAVPLNHYLKTRPDVQEHMGFVSKFILPYGTTQDDLDLVLPATYKRMKTLVSGPESDRTYHQTVIQIYRDMMTDYETGRRDKPPTWPDVLKRARNFFILRTVASAVSPAAPGFQSFYQPQLDAYRRLKEKDWKTADEKFLKQYGEEYFWLTGELSKSIDGVPPTIKGFKNRKKYLDLVQAHPDLGGLIVGADGAGEFNRAVYTQQTLTHVAPGDPRKERDMLTFPEATADPQVRLGWIKYTRFMKTLDTILETRGLDNYSASGASDLLSMRQAYLGKLGKELPSWYDDYQTHDDGMMRRRLQGMRAIVDTFAKDGRLEGRDDLTGLQSYLDARKSVQQVLAARAAAGGAKTLAAQSNSDLSNLWSAMVTKMTRENLAFGDLFHRWLEQDDLSVPA